jgi:hypothetical protein
MSANLHDSDFYAWTQQQAGLLRAGQFPLADIENLIEEIASLGEREKREVKSRLILVLLHLLKWQYQPVRRGASWRRTVNAQRTELALLLDDSPSLARVVEDSLARCYELARKRVGDETGLPLASFPQDCPWPAGQLLNSEFWPG